MRGLHHTFEEVGDEEEDAACGVAGGWLELAHVATWRCTMLASLSGLDVVGSCGVCVSPRLLVSC
jgi:hypothetical protein